MEIKKFETSIAGKMLSIEVGKLAPQASGSVRAQYGETVVLATVVMNKNPREGINYFPLTVEFDEKFYAAGRIKGSQWVKREGRPTDEAILSARLIDRTMRPLFNKRIRNEVQVIVTNLSFDGENDPDILGIIATSIAFSISDIPMDGPVAALRVAYDGSNFIFNPSYKEREGSPLDIVVSGPDNFINMIEARADQIPEDLIIKAISAAEKEMSAIISFQKEIQQKIGVAKKTDGLPVANEELRKEMMAFLGNRIAETIEKDPKMESVEDLGGEVVEHLSQKYPDDESLKGEIGLLLEEEIDKVVHQNILNHKKRPDGRALDEVRPLYIEVSTLPRTHGTGLFQRGATQALSILTLGAPGLEQSLETMEFVGKKRFMHHYNFPPFSTGETGRMFTGRREVGHGALAEKALEAVIPDKEKFPYTIRIVTEILSSNGSSSMASVCGSSLALMDAGVPITETVAGIAMGLVVENQEEPAANYAILTDIQGPEDHYGDMDLKVAGTKNGITVLQMDVKIAGLKSDMLDGVLAQAKKARLEIMEAMHKVISAPREKLSQHAPRVLSIKIDPGKIRDVIGSGGKMINQITEETGVAIDIEDDGLVFITSQGGGAEGAQKALTWIENITKEVEAGEVYDGSVVKILDFGAFVEILPNKQGLVHVSELAPWHVEKVQDVVKLGDRVKVRVKNIDNEGRINLSMKEFQEKTPPDNKVPLSK